MVVLLFAALGFAKASPGPAPGALDMLCEHPKVARISGCASASISPLQSRKSDRQAPSSTNALLSPIAWREPEFSRDHLLSQLQSKLLMKLACFVCCETLALHLEFPWYYRMFVDIDSIPRRSFWKVTASTAVKNDAIPPNNHPNQKWWPKRNGFSEIDCSHGAMFWRWKISLKCVRKFTQNHLQDSACCCAFTEVKLTESGRGWVGLEDWTSLVAWFTGIPQISF